MKHTLAAASGTGNVRPEIDERQRGRDARLRQRVTELVVEHRASGAAGHHARTLALHAAAKARVDVLSGLADEAAMIEAYAALFAAFEVMPASALLGVASRREWRARASTVRKMARDARRFVREATVERPRRASAASVLYALARNHFPRILEGYVSCASIANGELLVRRDVDRDAREEDLAWGIAAEAMREAHGGLRRGEREIVSEATARLAAQIRELARRAAEELARAPQPPRGGTSSAPPSGPSHRHEPAPSTRPRPSWRPRRSSAPEVSL